MKYFADLHIHSRYSRATSKSLDLEHLYYWAQLKGLHAVSVGDFVHPKWLDELKEKLDPAEEGFFRLKSKYTKEIDTTLPSSCKGEVRFLLSAEISSIYKKNDKVRKVHNVIFAPNFQAADNIQGKLDAIGNIHSDGRPILGLDSHNLLEIILESDPLSFLVPAHIWTPWFSVLGSKSGFDRIEECFEDLTKYIFAVETGLSSDPIMNWRLKQLDPFILISNSDAHSPSKLAREANIFNTEFSYKGIYLALSDPKNKGMLGTIEFFPEEGKYHYDGHRACNMRLTPKETRENKGACPVCGKGVTVGVMARVEQLADRKEGKKSPRHRPYYNFIPLPEVIGQARGVGPNSKSVGLVYHNLLSKLGNELYILQEAPLKDIEVVAGDLVREGINKMRKGDVNIAAGYDGEFGTIDLFSQQDRNKKEGQQDFLENANLKK